MRTEAGRAWRVLDFDIENRPLSYWIPDRPTAEVTGIAWAWTDRPSKVECSLLGIDTLEEMLTKFLAVYNEADMVTGHYIRKHDLPILNGALIEAGLPLLTEKYAQDTKLDMVNKADIPATQEFLSDTLGVKSRKYHMTQTMWRDANRLTPEGMALTEKRVTDDVRQHMKLRKAMLAAGMLHPPKVWRP